jgi:hypothetical protein
MDAPPLPSRPVSSRPHWTIPAPPQHLLLYILSEAPRSHGRIIFKHDSFDDKLVEAATDEAQAAPKKPQTDLLWCEKVLVKFTRILDDVSLHATEDSEE